MEQVLKIVNATSSANALRNSESVSASHDESMVPRASRDMNGASINSIDSEQQQADHTIINNAVKHAMHTKPAATPMQLRQDSDLSVGEPQDADRIELDESDEDSPILMDFSFGADPEPEVSVPERFEAPVIMRPAATESSINSQTSTRVPSRLYDNAETINKSESAESISDQILTEHDASRPRQDDQITGTEHHELPEPPFVQDEEEAKSDDEEDADDHDHEDHDARGAGELTSHPATVKQSLTALNAPADEPELRRRKLEGLIWLQNLLKSDDITLIPNNASQEEILKINLFDNLKSGVLLCRALNNLMKCNPSFVEQNLPLIEIGDKTDLFTSLANLSSFVRTCELYFNVDRIRLFEPAEFLRSKDEQPVINCLYFLKLVSDENGLNFQTMQIKPYVALTYEQLSTLVSMLTSKPGNPAVAYDPRVVLSVQDVESFQRLSAKINSVESGHKTLALFNINLNEKIEVIARDQSEMKSQLDSMMSGVLKAFQEISTKMKTLTDVTTVISMLSSSVNGSAEQLRATTKELAEVKKTMQFIQSNGTTSPLAINGGSLVTAPSSPMESVAIAEKLEKLEKPSKPAVEKQETLTVQQQENSQTNNPPPRGNGKFIAEKRNSFSADKPAATPSGGEPIPNYSNKPQSHELRRGSFSNGNATKPAAIGLKIQTNPQAATVVPGSPVPVPTPRTHAPHASLPSSPTQPSSPSANLSQPKVFRLPAEVLALNLPKEETMRQNVVYEILESEADYVRDLNVMINLHMKDLKARRILDDKETRLMFGNVEELLPVNQNLLSLINKRKEENPMVDSVGDLFLKSVDQFKVYDKYCANYPAALQLYKDLKINREDMRNYLERTMNDPEFRGLSLESFLIKPVQRICKYPLLLRELIKYTSKQHKDKPLLEAALSKIEEIVSLVNEKTRWVAERDKLLELQSRVDASPPLDLAGLTGRRLLKEGLIQRFSSGKPKDRYAAVLSDMIIICKPQLINKTRHQFETFIDLTHAYLNISVNPKILAGSGVASSKMVKTMFEITVIDQSQDTATSSFIFNCPTEAEKDKWATVVEEAINSHSEDVQKNPSKFRLGISPFGTTASSNSLNRASTTPAPASGPSRKNSNLSIRKRGVFSRNKGDSHESLDGQTGSANINEERSEASSIISADASSIKQRRTSTLSRSNHQHEDEEGDYEEGGVSPSILAGLSPEDVQRLYQATKKQ